GGGGAGGTPGRKAQDRHEVKLHPAEGLGLMKPEQPALVQELLVVADEHAGVLGALGALAQDRHDFARAAHRLVVADGGKIAPHPLRHRAHALALGPRPAHRPAAGSEGPAEDLPATCPGGGGRPRVDPHPPTPCPARGVWWIARFAWPSPPASELAMATRPHFCRARSRTPL